MSSSLVKSTTKAITQSKSVHGAAGKGLIIGGGSTLGVLALAAFLPFVGVLTLAIAMIVLGIFIAE